jgi:hypothetical protein
MKQAPGSAVELDVTRTPRLFYLIAGLALEKGKLSSKCHNLQRHTPSWFRRHTLSAQRDLQALHNREVRVAAQRDPDGSPARHAVRRIIEAAVVIRSAPALGALAPGGGGLGAAGAGLDALWEAFAGRGGCHPLRLNCPILTCVLRVDSRRSARLLQGAARVWACLRRRASIAVSARRRAGVFLAAGSP